MPRILVNNPPAQPWRYGLASAMTLVPNPEPHFEQGVEFQPTACADAFAWPGFCHEPPTPEPVDECEVVITATIDDEGLCICTVRVDIEATPGGEENEVVFTATATSPDASCVGHEIPLHLDLGVPLEPFIDATVTVGDGPTVLGSMEIDGTQFNMVEITIFDVDGGLAISDESGSHTHMTVTEGAGEGFFEAQVFCLEPESTCNMRAAVTVQDETGIVFASAAAGPFQVPAPECGTDRQVQLEFNGQIVILTSDASAVQLNTLTIPGVYEAVFTDLATGISRTLFVQYGSIDSVFQNTQALWRIPNGTYPIMASAEVTGGEGCEEERDIRISVPGVDPVVITTGQAPVEVAQIGVGQTLDVTATDIDSGDFQTQPMSLPFFGCQGGEDEGCLAVFVLNVPVPGPIGELKPLVEGRPLGYGDPVTIGWLRSCKAQDLGEARRTVAEEFSYAEQRELERVFWEGGIAGFGPFLADDPDLVVLPPASSLTEAVGALEEALAANYGGIGVIHAPRAVSAFVSHDNLLPTDTRGPQLTTLLGTVYAFGGGYDPEVGPVGQPAPGPGQVYLYATGQVVGRRGPVMVNPQDGGALNRTTNEVTVLAERTWVLTRDCVAFAILVDLFTDGGGE